MIFLKSCIIFYIIINLYSLTNCGESGLWCFHVGLIEDNVEHPDQKIGSYHLMYSFSRSTLKIMKKKSFFVFLVEELTWFANDTCSSSGVTLCHSKAQCLDEAEGFCCICKDGYYGNGFTCLKQGWYNSVENILFFSYLY